MSDYTERDCIWSAEATDGSYFGLGIDRAALDALPDDPDAAGCAVLTLDDPDAGVTLEISIKRPGVAHGETA